MLRQFALCAFFAAAIPLTQAAEPTGAVEDKQVPVSAKKEITINARNDDEVQSRELWFSRFDGKNWGEWQKHGLTFGRDTPIVWTPPEGHWRIYVKITQVSGLSMPDPTVETKGSSEFIIDRTAPVVSLQTPTSKAKVRGGQHYNVRWNAADPHITTTPITILWSRGGDGKFDTVAESIPNTGSYDWLVPKDMTTNGQLQVQAIDRAGNIGLASSTQVLVDSIAPSGRITGPAVTANNEIDVAVNVNDAGPSGLSSVQLWMSRDDGATWVEGPMITETPMKSIHVKASNDGYYRLALVSIDQAGNSSALPRGKADDQFIMLVDSVKPVISLPSANGITDADKAGPTARRAYKAGDRVQVQFIIKEVKLADNPVSIYLQTDPAKGWTELGKNLPADAAFRFELPKIATKNARLKITAVDVAGNLGEAVAAETFSIDTEVGSGDVSVDLK
jgi:hypothetical protein